MRSLSTVGSVIMVSEILGYGVGTVWRAYQITDQELFSAYYIEKAKPARWSRVYHQKL